MSLPVTRPAASISMRLQSTVPIPSSSAVRSMYTSSDADTIAISCPGASVPVQPGDHLRAHSALRDLLAVRAAARREVGVLPATEQPAQHPLLRVVARAGTDPGEHEAGRVGCERAHERGGSAHLAQERPERVRPRQRPIEIKRSATFSGCAHGA